MALSIEVFKQFLVLSEFLNFSEAAESLYISQPMLSRHINALETEFGLKLFNRTTQSVELTQAGEYLKKRVQHFLNEYDDICEGMHCIKEGYSTRLRIACLSYAKWDYLGTFPELFGELYPDIRLQYFMGDPYDAMTSLIEGKTDVAISPKHPIPHTKNLTCKHVFKERLGVLMNANNPLAAKDCVSLRELKDYTFFTVSNNYYLASWNHTLKLCKDAGYIPHDPIFFNQMESLIMALRRGNGVTVIGHHMRSLQSELIVYRPLIDKNCDRSVCIWYNPNSENEAIRLFLKHYLKFMSEHINNT